MNIGLIPFARKTDRGWFCFDAGEPCEMNEYKIVEYDREWGASRYISHRKQFDFMELIIELEDCLERWKLAKGI